MISYNTGWAPHTTKPAPVSANVIHELHICVVYSYVKGVNTATPIQHMLQITRITYNDRYVETTWISRASGILVDGPNGAILFAGLYGV